MNQSSIPAVWMRGGSSKGLFLLAGDLPKYERERDKVICRLFGSPDLYRTQMNGIGGATSSTSLVAIISESEDPEFDVEYVSGSVSIDTDVIDYSGFSANLSAAVGVFAVEQGLVIPDKDGGYCVKILQSNINRQLNVYLPIKDRQPLVSGNFPISGVSGTGAPIKVELLEPGLGKLGRVLSTGQTSQLLDVPGFGEVAVSLLSAGGNTVFVRAADVGLQGTEFARDIESKRETLNLLELIRCIAAVEMNISPTIEFARSHQPSSPKVVLVAKPQAFVSAQGQTITAQEQNICCRMLSGGLVHHAYTGTAAIATSVAAQIPGTIVEQLAVREEESESCIKIAHPGGIFAVDSSVNEKGGFWVAEKATFTRTARTLMIGEAFYMD